MTGRPVDAVQHVTTARCHNLHQPAVDLPIALTYRDTDPYAITITFNPNTPTAVTWHLARALFTEAIATGHAGHGDARLARVYGHLAIALHSPDADLYCLLPLPEVRRFLLTTYDVVPLHQEHVDIDGFIATVLGEVQP